MKKLLLLLSLSGYSIVYAQQADSVATSKQITDSIFQKVEVEAYFPGGEQAWNRYVQIQIEKNIDKIVRNKKKSAGTCEVQFIVDKDGTVTNVEALTLKGSLLAKILVDAIKDGPKWVPAYQFGKPVKAWRRQKVTFRMP